MEDTETFTLVPLYMDPASKIISSSNTSRALQEELAALNDLHKAFKKLDTDVPPPPIPVNPKRSAGITRLRESGNAEFRKGKHTDAINYYTLGLQMALTRPAWEPSGLVRDEVAGLYSNRAMAHVAISNWVEGSVDAEASVEAKKAGNAKAWWRKGRCLIEMGRLEEAKEWVGKGLEMEGNEADLVTLLKEIEGKDKKS
ncbi:Translocation protein [Lachnellula hyalina]|uniref:Translocation protein n=1 Tax=Lachnellula hyalina TaxID=1316788 RepID=A0A8H8QUC3_9HELO|nr:Translocation protein [Lachnellula hyalina]TVY22967.1 Translocation protein [Lachnellula hyalina]